MLSCFRRKPTNIQYQEAKKPWQCTREPSSITTRSVLPSPSVDSLRTSLATLPQELYDHIFHFVVAYDETDTNPISGTTLRHITSAYKPPVQLQINRELRASYALEYYSKSTFYIGDPDHTFNRQGKKWLGSLTDATCALFTDVRHPNPGIIIARGCFLGKCLLAFLDSRPSLRHQGAAELVVTYGSGRELLQEFWTDEFGGHAGRFYPYSIDVPTAFDHTLVRQPASVSYPGLYTPQLATYPCSGSRSHISRNLHDLCVKAHSTLRSNSTANHYYRKHLLVSTFWEEAFQYYEANKSKKFKTTLARIEKLISRLAGYTVSLR